MSRRSFFEGFPSPYENDWLASLCASASLRRAAFEAASTPLGVAPLRNQLVFQQYFLILILLPCQEQIK